MITRHILTLPNTGRRVHYRRCGTGPALLMIHQSPRSGAEYEPLMRQWGRHFTCIAPDSPGFGQSDPLPGTPEVADFAAALGEFAQALGLRRCAAYGFHSGGIILVAALKRRALDLSCLAVGGYPVWTDAERQVFGERYLPALHPAPYGEHLTWLWNRLLEQSWFFPWFDTRDAARLPGAHADIGRVHQAAMELLDAGDAYRAGYGAVLRAANDIPSPDEATAPVLITAYHGDPLQAHIDRLGELPRGWAARKVATPAEHQAESLAFLLAHADQTPCPALAEDECEGWLPLHGGLIHWRGRRGAKQLILHRPAAELAEPEPDNLAIDVPGHGLSTAFPDQPTRAVIAQAAGALGAARLVWPAAVPGDPALLYPDLTPDRFGAHLLRAWGAARAEALFAPWYAAGAAAAIPIDPTALHPAAIARRARARMRAGAAARAWHDTLVHHAGDDA